MSDASFSQQTHEFEESDVYRQWEKQWLVREQVSAALKEANAAFAAQFTQPDAYKFVEACDRLTKFLTLKVEMEESEQRSLVQTLQVACAMHENAIRNPTLSETDRSAHRLASTSLVPLCKSALDGNATHMELWCEMFNLSYRAEQALSNAADALDLSKYLDFDHMTEDCFTESGNSASGPPPSPVLTALKSATPRVSVHDITDDRHAPRPVKLKEQALVTRDNRPFKGAPLGRAHTMPTLSQTASNPYYSRGGRAPSKAPSRGHGLHALQKIGE